MIDLLVLSYGRCCLVQALITPNPSLTPHSWGQLTKGPGFVGLEGFMFNSAI